jgi:hypothetical protein
MLKLLEKKFKPNVANIIYKYLITFNYLEIIYEMIKI